MIFFVNVDKNSSLFKKNCILCTDLKQFCTCSMLSILCLNASINWKYCWICAPVSSSCVGGDKTINLPWKVKPPTLIQNLSSVCDVGPTYISLSQSKILAGETPNPKNEDRSI